jgi:peroxiredoxin
MRFHVRCFLLLGAAAATLAGNAAWARKAPDFSLPDAEGKTVTLSTYRGKYVVIDFMLTTCPHCQAAGQVLEKLQKEFPKRLQVISITNGEASDVLRQYVKDHGITYPVLAGDIKAHVDFLGLSQQNPNFQVPWFFFIAPSGEILEERDNGRASDREWFNNMEQNLEASVRKMLPPEQPAKRRQPPK